MAMKCVDLVSCAVGPMLQVATATAFIIEASQKEISVLLQMVESCLAKHKLLNSIGKRKKRIIGTFLMMNMIIA